MPPVFRRSRTASPTSPTKDRQRTILQVEDGLKRLNVRQNAATSVLSNARKHLQTWKYTETQLRASIRALVNAAACPLGPDGATILNTIVNAACGSTAPTDSDHCDVLLAMLEAFAKPAQKSNAAALLQECTTTADLFIRQFQYLYTFDQIVCLGKVRDKLKRVCSTPKQWTITF
jgi:hypothetical protein